MSEKASILVQLDTDALPSVFDRVVAVDSGVQHLFSYGGVTPENVTPLVHGCIFTRGPKDLAKTAIFVGGSDIAAGEAVLARVKNVLLPAFGLSVSVMLDSNGSNTTAVAAVRSAAKHFGTLKDTRALVLGGTGPVGQRAARLLAREGAIVRIGSRQRERAEAVCAAIRSVMPTARVEAAATATKDDAPKALNQQELVIAAGGPGVVLLPRLLRERCSTLKVAIDLNGVPPAGIEGVEPMDKATPRDGVLCYGALGVGGLKMKIHRAALQELFTKNNLVLDAEEINEIAVKLG